MELFVITIWVLFLLSFLSGYLLGQGKITKEVIVGAIQQAKKKLNTLRVGAIRQPTARDVYLKHHPELKEGMDEMSKDLKKQGL